MDQFTASQNPAWQQPSPQQMIEKILEQVKAHAQAKKVAVENIVFEYSDHVPERQAFVMPGRNFEDGRHRAFVHPSQRESIEAAVSDLLNAA